MTAAPRRWAAELLHVWFHELSPRDWFGRSERIDGLLARRFGPDLEMLGTANADGFLGDPKTALAGALLFDQVPRNMFRRSSLAFAIDAKARAITHGALRLGHADALASHAQRQFLCMPLMHSEDIADQQLSLTIYRHLGRRHGWVHARAHHAMIARFGRFPHRNAVLGRISTGAEQRAVVAGFAW